MADKINKCPKCGGEMESGIVIDRGQTFIARQIWAKSISFWKGAQGKLKVDNFRCVKCGYIESYAN